MKGRKGDEARWLVEGPMLSIDETAVRLGLGRWSVHRLIREGRLAPTVRVSERRRLIPERVVVSYLEARLVGPVGSVEAFSQPKKGNSKYES